VARAPSRGRKSVRDQGRRVGKDGRRPFERIGPGEFTFLPRDIPHGFRILEEAEVVTVINPPGLEKFFRDASFDFREQEYSHDKLEDTAAALEKQYGQKILGPLPKE
jgi:hypothetical protein